MENCGGSLADIVRLRHKADRHRQLAASLSLAADAETALAEARKIDMEADRIERVGWETPLAIG